MNTYKSHPQAFQAKADLLRALAHPQRLCIIKTLCECELLNVKDMQLCLDQAQSTVSQHLSRLKAAGLILGERQGNEIYYRIASPDLRQMLQELVQLLFTEREV